MNYFGAILLNFGVILLTITAVRGFDLSCYVTSSNSHALPDYAGNATLKLDSGACYKGRYIETLYRTTGGVQTKVNETIFYAWGAVNFTYLNDKFTCEDNWQTSSMTTTSSPDLVKIYYSRVCFCCGDMCNNATMDEQCNELPTFTKNCYGSLSTNPELVNPVQMPATSEMSCYKTSRKASEDIYSWGASNLIPNDKCGESDIFQGTDKMCTCCGNLCNDETMDLIIASNTECNKIPPLSCYVSVSPNSKLPADAPNGTVSLKSGACYKARVVLTLYATTGGVQTKINETITYVWGSIDLQALGNTLTCRDYSDVSIATSSPSPTLGYTAFTRTCFCCGDMCNGDGMNSQCNESPVFTQICHGGFGTSPELGKAMFKLDVSATPEMSCYKTSEYIGGNSTYAWGASNLLTIDKCGESLQFPSLVGIKKVCTCCGEKCNDESMDSILANNTDCKVNSPTTASAPLTTTNSSIRSLASPFFFLLSVTVGAILKKYF